MNATADIFDRLTDLTPDQLRELNARTSFLLNPQGEAAVPEAGQDTGLEMVGKEFTLALEDQGRRNIILPILLKTRIGKPFRSGARLLLQYVQEDFKCSKRLDQIKMIRHLLRLMIRDLQARGRDVTPLTLAQQMVAVANVVDRNYPGYRVAGMLPIVLKRLGSGPHPQED